MKFNISCRIPLSIKLMLVLMSSSSILTAQNRGLVLDGESRSPLVGVNIYLNNKEVLTKTNEKGRFYIKKVSGTNKSDTLNFSYVGYSSKRISISDLKESGTLVYLFKDTLSLKGVTVISNKLPLELYIHYEKLAPLKVGVYSFGSALIGNKIYVIGGNESSKDDPLSRATDRGDSDKLEELLKKMGSAFNWHSYCNKLQVYDMQTDSWRISDLKFRKRAYHNINYYNNRIYILGGKQISKDRYTEYLDNKIELYDMQHNKVVTDNTNPHQGVNFASFVYDNNLIVMGGSTKLRMDGKKVYSNKAHLLNLKNGLWYELVDMPSAKR